MDFNARLTSTLNKTGAYICELHRIARIESFVMHLMARTGNLSVAVYGLETMGFIGVFVSHRIAHVLSDMKCNME
jgi:hypothetical protein